MCEKMNEWNDAKKYLESLEFGQMAFQTPVDKLWNLAGCSVSADFIRHIWKKECDMDTDVAANMILDMIAQNELKDKETSWKEEKRSRMQFVDRVGYETPSMKANVVPFTKPMQENNGKIRYLDGEVVTTKGEKYVLTEKKQEWDGGSRGRVKTKGKRGKGFV